MCVCIFFLRLRYLIQDFVVNDFHRGTGLVFLRRGNDFLAYFENMFDFFSVWGRIELIEFHRQLFG